MGKATWLKSACGGGGQGTGGTTGPVSGWRDIRQTLSASGSCGQKEGKVPREKGGGCSCFRRRGWVAQAPLPFLAVHWLIHLFVQPSSSVLTALFWALGTWVGVAVLHSSLLLRRLAVTVRHTVGTL